MIEGRSVAVRADAESAGDRPKPKLSPEGILHPEGPLAHILVVEDERIVALDLVATLKGLGYAVATVSRLPSRSRRNWMSRSSISRLTPMTRRSSGPPAQDPSAILSNLSNPRIYIARLRSPCISTKSKPSCGNGNSGWPPLSSPSGMA